MSGQRHRLLVEERSRPIATLHLGLRSGTLLDPPGKEGLAHLTGQMLLRGAGDLSQEQIAERLDFLGSYLGVSVERNITSITGDALVRNIDALEEILRTALLQPTFPEDEVQRIKRQRLAELEQIRDHDSSLGYRFYSRRLFADHPYARPGLGTEASVGTITREDMVSFYEANYSSWRALEAGCGSIGEDRLRAFGESTVGALNDTPLEETSLPEVKPRSGWRTLLVDKPGRTQTQVFLGHASVSANHPDHLPLVLGNMVFGGTFTSRLSQEIREKRGWSYGVSSRLAADEHLGALTMRFYPSTEHTADAIALAADLYDSVCRDGVTHEELEAVRDHVIHGHPLSLETPARELQKRVSNWALGRPDDYVDGQLDRLRAVTLEQVNHALRTHLCPDDLELTVVCTADQLESDLPRISRIQSVETVDYMEP